MITIQQGALLILLVTAAVWTGGCARRDRARVRCWEIPEAGAVLLEVLPSRAHKPFWTPERHRGVLFRTTEGEERFIPDVHLESPWFCVCSDPPLFFFWEVGTDLAFERRGVRLFVRRDRGPRELAGIIAEGPEGIEALREAIAQGATRFTVWCPAPLIGDLPEFPAAAQIALAITDRKLPTPSAAEKVKAARAINIRLNEDIEDLSPLSRFTHLVSLDLSGSSKLSDLGPLRNLTSLRSLSLWGYKQVTDLSPLAGMTEMRRLHLIGCRGIHDLAPLAGMKQLTHLRMTYCEKVTDLRPLRGLTGLRALYLGRCPNISVLSPLEDMANLEFLELWDCKGVSDLGPLSKMSRLIFLNLHGCANVADLKPVAGMKELELISLDGCARIADLSPLSGLAKLRDVSLEGSTSVTDLSPLRAAVRRGAKVSVSDDRLKAQLARLRR